MNHFSSFNIIGYSSPLLPCRPVDLRRGLIYSENLQHTPSLSFHSSHLSRLLSSLWLFGMSYRNGLTFFELFILFFTWDWSWPPMFFLCSHDLCLFPLFLCFILHMITWPREVIIVLWSFYDFGVLLCGRIPTLIFFYFLHDPTTSILPVYVVQRRPHLEKDTTRPWGMVIRQVTTVPRRTRVTPD